jgi:ceramide glucosyltransferase
MEHPLALLFELMAVAGCIYVVAASVLFARIFRSPLRSCSLDPAPGVTILKPLRGDEPGLQEALASFCDQRYAGAVQIVFGLTDPLDPALPVVRRLQAERPECDIDVVIRPAECERNPKVANLLNMENAIRHDVVVIADSDISVPPDCLARLVSTLGEERVGLVTCLYHGVPAAGFWSRLSALGIDQAFLPGVLVGLALGLAQPCFGATMALRRTDLDGIGGFGRFRDYLADDHALGEAIRQRGLRVAVAPFLVAHLCREPTLRALWRHELRWARTLRSIRPLGFAGSVLTHPFPLALVAVALGGGATAAALTILALICLGAFAMRLDLALDRPLRDCPLAPLRALLSLGVFLAAYAGREVYWRGSCYRVAGDGTLATPRGTRHDDEDAVPAGALLRRLRWRRRLALSGPQGDPLVLVSDLAGPACGLGRGQPPDRRATAPDRSRCGR